MVHTDKREFYEMTRTLKETEREVISMQFLTTWTDGSTNPPGSVISRLL